MKPSSESTHRHIGRGFTHRPRELRVRPSSLLLTDAFSAPWDGGDRVLVSAVGSPEFVETALSRLAETAPSTRFSVLTRAPAAPGLDHLPPDPGWDASIFGVAGWRAVVFLTEDENHPDHRNALAFLVRLCDFDRAFLCESHFVLVDITRHTRTPTVDGRRLKTFFYLEPETWTYLYRAARDIPGQGVAVEIGSYVGGSAVAIGMGCRDAAKAPLVSIDEVLVAGWYANIEAAGLSPHVLPLEASSHRAAAGWPRFAHDRGLPPEIRLLFIDGDHGFEAVEHDLDHWGRHVAANGEIVVHDFYNPFHPGPARACMAWLAAHPDWKIVHRLPEAVVLAR